MISRGKGGGSLHFEAFGPRKLQNSDSLAAGCLCNEKIPIEEKFSGGVVGVSILKLLGLENSKTVTPSQVAAFLMTNSQEGRFPGGRVVGVCILKLLGLENSKTVTPLQVAAF